MKFSRKNNQPSIHVLQTLKTSVRPDVAWVQQTRARVFERAKATLDHQPMSWSAALKSFLEIVVPVRVINIVGAPVMAVVLMVVIALGGSVASVSAADRSLPGDFLYSLKLATEQARLVLKPAKEDKLKLKLEFTSRRTEELEQVVALDGTGGTRAAQAAEILKRDLHTVKQQLNDVKRGISSQKAVEIAKLVDQKSNEVVQKLQATKGALPENAKGKVVEAQAAAADAGVQAIEVLVEKSKEPDPSVLPTEIVQAIEDHTKTVVDATGVIGIASLENASSVAVFTTSTFIALPLEEAVQQTRVATQQAFALTLLREGSANVVDPLSGTSTSAVASSVSSSTNVIVSSSTTGSVDGISTSTPSASTSTVSSVSSSTGSGATTTSPP